MNNFHFNINNFHHQNDIMFTKVINDDKNQCSFIIPPFLFLDVYKLMDGQAQSDDH